MRSLLPYLLFLLRNWLLLILVGALVAGFTVAALLRTEDGVSGILWREPEPTPAVVTVASPEPGLTVVPLEPAPLLAVGFYDPEGTVAVSASIAVDHYFVNWNTVDSSEMRQDLELSSERNRWPMVTVEPFAEGSGGLEKETLLEDVVTGLYDDVIETICGEFGEYGRPILVRWGHEMESVTGRYPWATDDHQAFVEAFRAFVTSCRSAAGNALFVWSPVGNEGLEQYWPGLSYVDYVGLSLFSSEPEGRSVCVETGTFDDVFAQRYARVERFGLPVILAELGVQGSKSYREEWLTDALISGSRYRLLKILVYFNAVDTPGIWSASCPPPDWTIEHDSFADSYIRARDALQER